MTLATLLGTKEVGSKVRNVVKFKQIRAVYEIMKVHDVVADYLSTTKKYTAPSQVYETFRFLMYETKEVFLSVHLDGKNKIVCVDLVSIGSLNQSIVHPREVFKTALLSNAAAIILIHQHPTGDPTPSPEDITITRRLMEAGEMIGVKVLGHIIVGDTYYSLSEHGLI